MNWRTLLISLISVMTPFTVKLFAQEDIYPPDMGSESISQPLKEAASGGKSPFSFSAFFDAVDKAEINKGFFKRDHFQFAIANAELAMIFYYNALYEEAANISLGYTETYFGWHENPWFEQTHFHTLSLTLGGITKRVNRWLWRGQLQVNYDGWDELSAEYFNYDIIFWGRYTCCSNVGIHMGFFVETGMRMDRIYPIIGFDWQINSRWKLNAVFPFDMALEYLINKYWTVALAGRTFSSRHRINPDDCHPKYVTRYSNGGIEAMIKYTRAGVSANLHAGVTLGGDLKIANSHNHKPHHYHLDSAGYIGGEVDVRF